MESTNQSKYINNSIKTGTKRLKTLHKGRYAVSEDMTTDQDHYRSGKYNSTQDATNFVS